MAEENDKKLEPGDDETTTSDAVGSVRKGWDEDDQDVASGDEGDGRKRGSELGSDGDDREAERLAARERRLIEREERALAKAREADDVVPMTGLLGIERWVQFAFLATGVITFYLSDALISFVWERFAEPDSTIVSGSSLILGILVGFFLYRHPPTNQFVFEVVGELGKVTWPTRDETYYSTLVVIITSVIAALYTGVFDALWSTFTDLIYGV